MHIWPSTAECWVELDGYVKAQLNSRKVVLGLVRMITSALGLTRGWGSMQHDFRAARLGRPGSAKRCLKVGVRISVQRWGWC